MSEPELRIVHLDDVPWQEVRSQQHGERRVSLEGVTPLPNPPFEAPAWSGARTDGDPGATAPT